MAIIKMLGDDPVIGMFKEALEGKPNTYRAPENHAEMERIKWLVSGLLDPQKKDCLGLIDQLFIRNRLELLRIRTPEEFKEYYIIKSGIRERVRGIMPINEIETA